MGILYTVFVAIMLAVTTGYGVAAFYPQPIRPQYPVTKTRQIIPQSCYQTPQTSQAPDCQKYFEDDKSMAAKDQEDQKKYQDELQKYDNVNAGYSRTTVFFGVTFGAFFAILGLLFIKKSRMVANGLILAGVLTAIATRLLVSLASWGTSVTGTTGASTLAFVEFGILGILSIAVLVVGLYTLKDFSANNSN
jgi:hypothetical protein